MIEQSGANSRTDCSAIGKPSHRSVNELLKEIDFDTAGAEMHRMMVDLFPIPRSITGNGVRETLSRLGTHIPLNVHEVSSGTPVFDWSVPQEWNIRDAYIRDASGHKILDLTNSNLHVLNYSTPVHKKVSLEELKHQLYTLPEHPDWIPYRTSYYQEKWGFCMSHAQYQELKDETYEVYIDSSLEDGHLSYGELLIEGAIPDEILISTHICHPSMCNDNLSGLVLSTFLAKYLAEVSPRYSYRFLFIPGTIGSITWLALNESELHRIKHGLVIACVGDSGSFTYKKSRRGDAEVDKAVLFALEASGSDFSVQDFVPYGYDERQFCSPGIDLPVGCLMRTPHGEFPEYHTSADNLALIKPKSLGQSLHMSLTIMNILDRNRLYKNLMPKCEPQLGRRGLYESMPDNGNGRQRQFAMLWLLNYSDGQHDLMDIASRSKIDFDCISEAASALVTEQLLGIG